ncbi:MAG TPA: GxxExxY protein [Desulfatiglandales bacterium]|nr:GxxExxY protein [Desulfatiglandales bacterium]
MDINKLNNKIIEAAIEIHKTLGPVLLESAYPVKYTIYKIQHVGAQEEIIKLHTEASFNT